MCRNWKRIAALGLTVILGCMAPMSTMLAAEDGTDCLLYTSDAADEQ